MTTTLRDKYFYYFNKIIQKYNPGTIATMIRMMFEQSEPDTSLEEKQLYVQFVTEMGTEEYSVETIDKLKLIYD